MTSGVAWKSPEAFGASLRSKVFVDWQDNAIAYSEKFEYWVVELEIKNIWSIEKYLVFWNFWSTSAFRGIACVSWWISDCWLLFLHSQDEWVMDDHPSAWRPFDRWLCLTQCICRIAGGCIWWLCTKPCLFAAFSVDGVCRVASFFPLAKASQDIGDGCYGRSVLQWWSLESIFSLAWCASFASHSNGSVCCLPWCWPESN